MGSKASAAFTENTKDIERLWEIHEEVAGKGPGRKHDVDILNRAAVVFITACWESYVEDVALEAFDWLLANATSAAQIPSKIQAAAAESMKGTKNALDFWALADAGWRAVLQGHRAAVKKKWVDSLNTPKHSQVDSLFEDLLGVRSVSSAWHWNGMPSGRAIDKLDEYISIRGNIAHRVRHDETVYKDWSSDYLGHVKQTVEKTDDEVSRHLKAAVGSAPW